MMPGIMSEGLNGCCVYLPHVIYGETGTESLSDFPCVHPAPGMHIDQAWDQAPGSRALTLNPQTLPSLSPSGTPLPVGLAWFPSVSPLPLPPPLNGLLCSLSSPLCSLLPATLASGVSSSPSHPFGLLLLLLFPSVYLSWSYSHLFLVSVMAHVSESVCLSICEPWFCPWVPPSLSLKPSTLVCRISLSSCLFLNPLLHFPLLSRLPLCLSLCMRLCFSIHILLDSAHLFSSQTTMNCFWFYPVEGGGAVLIIYSAITH